MQSLFLPVVALSFAVAPVVRQNFGGRQQIAFAILFIRRSVLSLMMVVLAVTASLASGALIRFFSRDPKVIAFGSEYLRDYLIQLRIVGNYFHQLQRFPGNRQHAAATV